MPGEEEDAAAAIGAASPNSTSGAAFNGTCEVFDGDQHKCEAVNLIYIIVGSVSIVACLFIFFIQWLYKKYYIFVQRMVLCLTISAFLGSIVKMMAGDPLGHPKLCVFQGWGYTFTSWATMAWICSITFNLYMNAVLEISTEKFEWLYHVVSWVCPLIISFIPFAANAYGQAGAWCWIKPSWKWRFGIWYCPYIIVVLLLFAIYSYIIYKVNAKVKTWQGHFDPDTEQKRLLLKKEVMPLRVYPLIYLLLGIFPLVDRIHNAITEDSLYALKILHAFFTSLQGAVNALVFCLDKETVDHLHWSQLKLAFHRRLLRVKTEIYEYPAEADTQPAMTETPPAKEGGEVNFSLGELPDAADSHI